MFRSANRHGRDWLNQQRRLLGALAGLEALCMAYFSVRSLRWLSRETADLREILSDSLEGMRGSD